MRLPSSISPPVGRFADALLAIDLPDLDSSRRATVVGFIERRVTILPSFTRFGVTMIAFTLDAVSRVVGLDRVIRFVAAKPLPVLAEYPRLIRSLAYAYVWETWPSTTTSGGTA
jgi:hypothetical protein